jgi:hypothetical protein
MQVMHRTGFLINSVSDGTQRHTENMATGTKKRQSESPKSSTKKTNSRRRQRKND